MNTQCKDEIYDVFMMAKHLLKSADQFVVDERGQCPSCGIAYRPFLCG